VLLKGTKSFTLDDPEVGLNGQNVTVAEIQKSFVEPTKKFSMKTDPYYQLQNVGK